jgi:hypothetical protein
MDSNTMLDLLSLSKSAGTAVSFVTGGAFLTALDAIGGVHMQAAQDAFRAVPLSKSPREAMNRALCHLEAAHVAFRSWWTSSLADLFRRVKCSVQADKDIRTCCLMALIHRLLGDDDSLVLQAINLAEEAYGHLYKYKDGKPMTVLGGTQMVAGALLAFSPLGWGDLPKLAQGMLEESEFVAFKKQILGKSFGPTIDAGGR